MKSHSIQALSGTEIERDQEIRSGWLSLLKCLEESDTFTPLKYSKVDELDVWPIIKATLIMEALNRSQRTQFRQPIMRHSVQPAQVGASQQESVHLAADALFLANFAPAFRQNGILLNPHLDPLRNALENAGMRTIAAYYDAPSHLENVAYSSIGLAGYLHVAKSLKLTDTANQEMLACRAALHSALEHEKIDMPEILESIAKRISSTLKLRSRFKELFEANKHVRSLFLTNYYGPHGWAAIAAAKSLGMVTTDIQHGLQGRFHHAYSWPEITIQQLSTIPERFLNWTTTDVANLDRYRLTAGRAIHIGPSQFQLEQLVSQEVGASARIAEVKLTYNAQAEELRKLSAHARLTGRKIAGLFLQYKEDDRWLQELRKETPTTVELWVRRHPGVRQSIPSPRHIQGVTYVDEYFLSLLLLNVDISVTGYSSVGIEAAHVGCPVVAYSPMAKEFLEEYCTSTGLILCRPDIRSIASAISNTVATGNRERANLPSIEKVALRSAPRNGYFSALKRYIARLGHLRAFS